MLCTALTIGCQSAAPDASDGVSPDAADAAAIDVGFDGESNQFAYFADFYSLDTTHPRLCHGYFAWDVGEQAPGAGDPTDPGSRAFLDAWLAAAAGTCDEALIALKSPVVGAPPTADAYAAAFADLVAADWPSETGFTGALVFSPWNEPNNAGLAGDGLGVQIPPALAADYYLAAEAACSWAGCGVVAGDFATNGTMWQDLSWNCADDNVPTDQLCATASSENPDCAPASYLDVYKNEIAQHADDAAYQLGAGFRPPVVAYHGWHDTNGYLGSGAACTSYADCAALRLEKSLGGSWGGVKVWDTEDGMGQNGALADDAQACGAAFVLRLATVTDRLERVYITRLDGGDDEIDDDHVARPALGVLAKRETTYATGCP